MAANTRTSPEVRRAERRRLEEEVAAQAKLERDAFRLTLPHLLLLLAARIRPFGEAIVKPNGVDGYYVEYRFHNDAMSNTSLGLETEEWGVAMVRNKIEECELEVKIREERLAIAREGWASLTAQQQCAMIDLGLARKP
jgi:hypothetical protein